MLALSLDEVSTIYDGSLTRQLTLSDLGTDCPQTAAPSAIATMVDSRCDPILAAPKQVSSWAYPCNACGRFGLFDPPYAVPTLTGGLVSTTTAAASVTTTTVPTPTSTTIPSGTVLVVYYLDGHAMATATIPTTGVTGVLTSSVTVSTSSSTSSTSESVNTPVSVTTASTESLVSVATTSPTTPTSTSTSATEASSLTSLSTSLATSSSTSASTSPTSTVATASATRVVGGFAWSIAGVLVAVFLL
jgi:hypothetical protein